MRISCTLRYGSDSVVCFDPEKVLVQLLKRFPDGEVDHTDLAAAEVERFREFLDTQPDMTDERRATMLRQIRGKARRNGPRYSFTLPGDITGYTGRYSIDFWHESEIDPTLEKQIVEFLQSLKIGTVDVKK